MSTLEQRDRFATVLRRVAFGEISPERAISLIEQWVDIPWEEKIFRDASHFLIHFRDDADIRAKYEDYARSQTQGLLAWADELSKP